MPTAYNKHSSIVVLFLNKKVSVKCNEDEEMPISRKIVRNRVTGHPNTQKKPDRQTLLPSFN